jgi:diguanylate cyclase (GGDEF)-like protein
MQPQPTKSAEKPPQLPPSIDVALVDSLGQNPGAVLAGTLCCAAAALMTAWRTDYELLWLCAVLIMLSGFGRTIQMRNYERRTAPLTVEEARAWEPRYRLGSLAWHSALGLWAMVVLLGTTDRVAHLLAVVVTIGFTAAGAGRNYGRPGIVQMGVLAACGPMSLGLALYGDYYYFALMVLLVLFFIGLKQINLSLHEIFVNALAGQEREAALAGQFDTALKNMPLGLCMFGSDGALAVVNQRFVEMMGIEGGRPWRGKSVRDVVAACVDQQTLPAISAEAIVAGIEGSQSADITTTESAEGGDRAFEWTFQPMAGGGTVVLVGDVTERRNAEARISHMARFDELTGLPNRISFRDEVGRDLARRVAADPMAALMFIDLDQFKQVNDTLGHPCGDSLLCMVADRLRAILTPNEFVARFGGDEFVVYVRRVETMEKVADLAREIVARLSDRYSIDDLHVVEIGASIGIALATEANASVDVLLKNADMALYRAKADGRGAFCFFREEIAKSVEARRQLEFDLRSALANEQFELFYQPLVNLKSGRITTCEALLRWNHPVRGSVSPGEMIPVAEEMGLIVDLGKWILRKACQECMKWPAAVRVAVNLSPLQFHQRDVVEDVRDALEISGLPAQRLDIEITESSLLRNTQKTRDSLAQLRDLGVNISLDDFGTGYSSLSYLHNFPLQKVKIDRSFLEGIGNDRPLKLLRGVARLSVDLGMSVVVEGVETNEQLEAIAHDGTVTEVQGYLFSKPVPATQIRQLLAASHGRPAEDAVVDISSRLSRA